MSWKIHCHASQSNRQSNRKVQFACTEPVCIMGELNSDATIHMSKYSFLLEWYDDSFSDGLPRARRGFLAAS